MTMPRITWDVAPDAWRVILARCPHATFYHTPGWYDAQAAALGYWPTAAHLVFEDGNEALLPMATRRKFRGALVEAFAGIESGYGGLVSVRPLAPAQVEAAYAAVRRRYPDLTVTGSPFEGYANAPAGGRRQAETTHVVPIVEAGAQLARMAGSRAKGARRALKQGFRFEATGPLEAPDAERFYPLYAEHAAAWTYGRWVKDEAYFRTLFRHAGADLRLLLAWDGEVLAAARLVGLTGPVAMGLHMARARGHEKSDAATFLAAQTFDWCRAEGIDAFDLAASGRLEAVRAFKASLGAEERPYAVAATESWLGAGLGAVRRLAFARGTEAA